MLKKGWVKINVDFINSNAPNLNIVKSIKMHMEIDYKKEWYRTWTGNSFHTYFTCFNAILPNLPTLSLSCLILTLLSHDFSSPVPRVLVK